MSAIEIQCQLNGEWKCVHGNAVILPSNNVQEILIVLPHSGFDTSYELRIRKCYQDTLPAPAETFSDIFEVHQRALSKLCTALELCRKEIYFTAFFVAIVY